MADSPHQQPNEDDIANWIGGTPDPPPQGKRRQGAPQKVRRCPYCQEKVAAGAVKCGHCGENLGQSWMKEKVNATSRPKLSRNVARPDAGLAAVFGFLVPGLGQIYGGRIWPGILVFLFVETCYWVTGVFVWSALFRSRLASFLLFVVFVALPVGLFIHIKSIFDAYRNVAPVELMTGDR